MIVPIKTIIQFVLKAANSNTNATLKTIANEYPSNCIFKVPNPFTIVDCTAIHKNMILYIQNHIEVSFAIFIASPFNQKSTIGCMNGRMAICNNANTPTSMYNRCVNLIIQLKFFEAFAAVIADHKGIRANENTELKMENSLK